MRAWAARLALRQRVDLGRRKKIGPLAERGVVLLDIVGERRDPRLGFDRAGGAHGAAATARPSASASAASILPACAKPVERRVLVEAAHFDRPFDRACRHRRARAGRPASRVIAHHAAVDLGRERPVDAKLRLAGALALGERRIVQERKAHRALDLEGAVAGEKHRGRMGIDALDRLAAMGRGVGQQGEDRLLARRCHSSRCASPSRRHRRFWPREPCAASSHVNVAQAGTVHLCYACSAIGPCAPIEEARHDPIAARAQAHPAQSRPLEGIPVGLGPARL